MLSPSFTPSAAQLRDCAVVVIVVGRVGVERCVEDDPRGKKVRQSQPSSGLLFVEK